MVWAFLLANLLVVLVAAGVRYGGADLAFAWPFGWGAWAWWPVTAAAAVGMVAAAVVGRARLARAEPRRALLELTLIFPVFFAFEWFVLPPYHWRAIDWTIMAALVAAVTILMWLDRRRWKQWGVTGRNFLPAARLLVLPTAGMIAAPVVVAIFIGSDFEVSRLPGAALYPLYALGQLAIFQVFLVPRLRRMAGSGASVIVVAACIFALLHWPNGVVMAACFLAAAVWTAVYLRRPNVFALALSMGLAAAALVNALPRERTVWRTNSLRTGPIYVQRLLDGAARK